MSKNYWKGDFLDFFIIDNELRTTVVHPYLAKNTSKLKCKDVLDFGCGEGDLLHYMDFHCIENYTGYDPAEDCINQAKINHKDKLENVCFINKLDTIEDKKFDAIILSFVLITIDNPTESQETFQTITKLLKVGGKLLFCETHPCFRDKTYSTLETDMDIDDYHKPCHPIKVTLSNAIDSHKTVLFEDYHKSLGYICELITAHNIYILKLEEIYDKKPNEKSSDIKIIKRYRESTPPFIYIEGTKL